MSKNPKIRKKKCETRNCKSERKISIFDNNLQLIPTFSLSLTLCIVSSIQKLVFRSQLTTPKTSEFLKEIPKPEHKDWSTNPQPVTHLGLKLAKPATREAPIPYILTYRDRSYYNVSTVSYRSKKEGKFAHHVSI